MFARARRTPARAPLSLGHSSARLCAALLLASAIACRHDVADDATPSQVSTEPLESLTDWSAPALAEDPSILVVPTYEGSGQSVHPDIVDFTQRWNGARYWMAMTPYPYGDTKRENPSLLVSDDARALEVPYGVVNPLVPPLSGEGTYNSDPDLAYDEASGQLVLSYRVVADGRNTIKVMTSTDGGTWTVPRVAFSERSHGAVSQSMVPGVRRMPAMVWYVDAGETGCGARSTHVMTRRAKNSRARLGAVEWGPAVVTDLVQPNYNIWHLKVRYVPTKNEYWMLYVAYPADGRGCGGDDLFLAHSKDGVHWVGFAEPVLRHGDREWSFGALYRGSFLYDPDRDELSVWFSAKSGIGVWRMLYARFRYSMLEARLSRGSARFDRAGRGGRRRDIWTDAP